MKRKTKAEKKPTALQKFEMLGHCSDNDLQLEQLRRAIARRWRKIEEAKAALLVMEKKQSGSIAELAKLEDRMGLVSAAPTKIHFTHGVLTIAAPVAKTMPGYKGDVILDQMAPPPLIHKCKATVEKHFNAKHAKLRKARRAS